MEDKEKSSPKISRRRAIAAAIFGGLAASTVRSDGGVNSEQMSIPRKEEESKLLMPGEGLIYKLGAFKNDTEAQIEIDPTLLYKIVEGRQNGLSVDYGSGLIWRFMYNSPLVDLRELREKWKNTYQSEFGLPLLASQNSVNLKWVLDRSKDFLERDEVSDKELYRVMGVDTSFMFLSAYRLLAGKTSPKGSVRQGSPIGEYITQDPLYKFVNSLKDLPIEIKSMPPTYR